MRRIPALFALAAVVALGAFAGSASTAAADSGNKISYGPFTYQIMPNAPDIWTCSGFRLTAGSEVKDHFTCTVADQTFTGTFTESNPWPCGCTGWASDYDGQVATSYVIRVSPNGKVEGNASY